MSLKLKYIPNMFSQLLHTVAISLVVPSIARLHVFIQRQPLGDQL